MSTSKVIGGLLVAAGVGTVAYLAYKRFGPQAGTAPAPGLQPAGTSSTGVQQYINQAGQLVDSAGRLVNTVQNVLNPFQSGTAAQFEGKLITDPNDGKGQYIVMGGKKRWAATWALVDKYKPINGRNAIRVDMATWNSIPLGEDLAGLHGLGNLNPVSLII